MATFSWANKEGLELFLKSFNAVFLCNHTNDKYFHSIKKREYYYGLNPKEDGVIILATFIYISRKVDYRVA